MPRIYPYGIAVARYRLLEVLVRREFVTAERVRVGIRWIQLYRSTEECDRGFMLLLKREAVPDHEPRFGRHPVECHRLLRQVRQLHLLLQLPERGGQYVQSPDAMGFDPAHDLQRTVGILIVGHFEVSLTHLVLYPSRIDLFRWEFSEQFERITGTILRVRAKNDMLVQREKRCRRRHKDSSRNGSHSFEPF